MRKNKLMIIHLIAAARPNFMKVAPLYHSLKKEAWAEPIIVHTGQHYDLNMSDAFFSDLKLPDPHIHLGVGSGSHAEQTGNVMIAYEKVLVEKRPDLVIVVGDVNSTLACTIAAVKIVYPRSNLESTNNIGCEPDLTNKRRPIVAHLEAGLRSFDRSMPEEINRIATDSLADILWTPSPDGDYNLMKEGVGKDKIDFVGNIMIDSLEMMRTTIEQKNTVTAYGLKKASYGVVTFHRPSNVDSPEILTNLCDTLMNISENVPLFFPIHPRTKQKLSEFRLLEKLTRSKRIITSDPLGYVDFMNIVFNCRICITDSGGLQEETSYLGIPCLTMRPNTERPVTIDYGTNRLCSLSDMAQIADNVLAQDNSKAKPIENWDGNTALRVVESIKTRLLE